MIMLGIGRFPYIGMTGDLVKIIASDNGARIIPEPQEPGQKLRYFALVTRSLPVLPPRVQRD